MTVRGKTARSHAMLSRHDDGNVIHVFDNQMDDGPLVIRPPQRLEDFLAQLETARHGEADADAAGIDVE